MKKIKNGTYHPDYINNGLVMWEGRWIKDKWYVNTGEFKIITKLW